MAGVWVLGGFVGVHLVAAALTGGLTVYAVRERWGEPIGRAFAAMTLSFLVWTVGSLFRTLVTDPAAYVALTTVKYLGVTTAPVCIFVFALLYAGRERLVTRWTVGGLLVVPVLTLLALATTLQHGLFYSGFATAEAFGRTVLGTSRGPVFWAFAVYGWGLIALGSLLLGYAAVRKPSIYRAQSGLVVLGVVLAWAVSLAYIFRDWPHGALDPTPVAFAFASALFAVGVFTVRLVDVVPAAWSEVVDAIDTAVVVLDADDRVVDRNDTAERLFGEGRIGRQAAESLPEELVAAIDDGDRESVVELDVDGERRYFSYRVLPLGARTSLGRVVALTDVTDQHRARQRIQQRNRELERQNEQLDEFASIVSHDLRSPLSVAKGNVELLVEDHDLEGEDTVGAVRDAHAKMERLIEDLLSMAREGDVTETLRPVEARALAEEAWEWVPASEARLAVVGDPGTVEADPKRLKELFENLFINAVEHGGEDVTVRIGPTPGGFYVADDGAGIPPEDRGNVFEYGYSTETEGTGFGLAIVDRIVQAHGWAIDVTESADGGARFEITTTRPPGSESRETGRA